MSRGDLAAYAWCCRRSFGEDSREYRRALRALELAPKRVRPRSKGAASCGNCGGRGHNRRTCTVGDFLEVGP